VADSTLCQQRVFGGWIQGPYVVLTDVINTTKDL
jgi:hypothetical protein